MGIIRLGVVVGVVSAVWMLAPQLKTAEKGMSDHVMMRQADIHWGDAPPSLPKGAKAFVLFGDPGAAAPFAIRLKMPAGYKIPAHSHPVDEHVTVLSGDFHMGLGDKLKMNGAERLGPGGFDMLKAGTNHFAFSKKGAVIQLNDVGPWDIKYVNPADDPRNK